MASSSTTGTPYPFDRHIMVPKEASSEEDYLVLKEARSRRLRRAENERKAVMAYTGDSVDRPEKRKRRTYTKINLLTAEDAAQQLRSGDSGLDKSMETDASSSDAWHKVMGAGTDAVGSDTLSSDSSKGKWSSNVVLKPRDMPVFEEQIVDGKATGMWLMLEPYHILVEAKSKQILVRLTKEEVKELLSPFAHAIEEYEAEPEGISKVVEAYWIARLEATQEDLLRRDLRGKSKAGIGSDSKFKSTWSGTAHTYTCPDCNTRRANNNKSCLMCKSARPPVILEKRAFHLKIGAQTWVFDPSSSSTRWHTITSSGDSKSKAGAFGPDTEDNKVVEQTDDTLTEQLKDGVSEHVSTFAQDPIRMSEPPQVEASVSDYVKSSERQKVAILDYEDPLLLSVMEGMDMTPPVFDPSQRAVAFNPILLEAKVSLFQLEQEPEVKEVLADLKKSKKVPTVEESQQEAQDILDLREGALMVDTVTAGGAILQTIDATKVWDLLQDPAKELTLETWKQNQTTIEVSKEQNRQRMEENRQKMMDATPLVEPSSIWGDELALDLESGEFSPWQGLRTLDEEDFKEAAAKYLQFKSQLNLKKITLPAVLFSELPPMRNPDAVGSDVSNLAKGMAMLEWMIKTQQGSLRISGGAWKLMPGPLQLPTWADRVQNISDDDQRRIESKTWPIPTGQYGISPPYTTDQLQEQAKMEVRPYLNKIVKGFWANHTDALGSEDGTHWQRQLSTWDLPSFIKAYGHKYTLKKLWALWNEMPMLNKPHRRGDRSSSEKLRASSNLRLENYQQAKDKVELYYKNLGLPIPKGDLYRQTLKMIGTMIAASAYISHTPQVIMELPVVTTADSPDRLRERVIYDDRITLTAEMLQAVPELWKELQGLANGKMVEVKCFYRCNNFIWWLAEAEEKDVAAINERLLKGACAVGQENPGGDASDNFIKLEGEAQQTPPMSAEIESTSDSKTLTAMGLLPPPIPQFAKSAVGLSYRKKHKLSSRTYWFGAECGLVLPALSNWEVKVKEKGIRASTGYVCVHCSGTWKGGRGGGYMLQFRSMDCLAQVIMDSPPERDWNNWANSRMEFYKRLEPNASLRDEAPERIPSSLRVRLKGQASDLLWQLVLSNPDKQALQNITDMARRHVAIA